MKITKGMKRKAKIAGYCLWIGYTIASLPIWSGISVAEMTLVLTWGMLSCWIMLVENYEGKKKTAHGGHHERSTER